MNAPRVVFAVAVLGALESGCVHLSAASTPPPTRAGEHASDPFGDDVVHIAKGTVLAFDCVDTWSGAPCDPGSLSLDKSDVAKLYPAHLAREKSPWSGYEVKPRTGFVLAAVKEGEVTLLIRSPVSDKVVRVIVE